MKTMKKIFLYKLLSILILSSFIGVHVYTTMQAWAIPDEFYWEIKSTIFPAHMTTFINNCEISSILISLFATVGLSIIIYWCWEKVETTKELVGWSIAAMIGSIITISIIYGCAIKPINIAYENCMDRKNNSKYTIKTSIQQWHNLGRGGVFLSITFPFREDIVFIKCSNFHHFSFDVNTPVIVSIHEGSKGLLYISEIEISNGEDTWRLSKERHSCFTLEMHVGISKGTTNKKLKAI